MAFVEVLIAGVAAFMLGFAWYTALFGKIWQVETGVTDEQAQQGVAVTHGVAFLMMLIIAFALNMIMGFHEPVEQTFVHGAQHGLMAWSMFALPVMVIHYLYQKKSFKLILIDVGYTAVIFALMGAIVGGLHLT